MTPDQLAACQGKHGFPSPQIAQTVARNANASVVPYRCRWCGLWHLGGAR